MSAHTSPRRVAWASAESNIPVLPDEAGPQISVRQPRGRPPVNESSCAIPLETISGAGRISSREAGTTRASIGAAPTAAKISSAFVAGFLSPSSADFFGQRGEGGKGKIKGRLVAADEKIGEADILTHSLTHNCQGTRLGQPGRIKGCSLFIRQPQYAFSGQDCQEDRQIS
jgi:hypothetical protein